MPTNYLMSERQTARWDSKLIHGQETGLALSKEELKSEGERKVNLGEVGSHPGKTEAG